MIPLMRSLYELKVITQSRDEKKERKERENVHSLSTKTNENKRQVNKKGKETPRLPEIPNTQRRKWARSKKAILRFLDELDYNNQIQSSYDLTLIDRQNDYDRHKSA